MLNNEIITQRYTNRCLSNCPYFFIAREGDPGNEFIRIVITYLNDYEEQLLDKRQNIIIRRDKLKFDIHPQYVIAYGDLDLSPNSDDIKQIESTGAFDRHTIRIFMPSEYQYETHTVISDRPAGRWYETNYAITFLPYLHGCLNKPDKVVIFKEYYNYSEFTRKAKRKAYMAKRYADDRELMIAKQRQYREMRKKEKLEQKLRTLKIKIKR